MNLRIMMNGRKVATDGHPLNDQMTQSAISFMESEVTDPELRNLVRPDSKCLYSKVHHDSKVH